MNQALFRKEAIDHQRERLMGEIILTQPLSRKIWMCALVIVVFLIIAFLAFGTYTRKERVQGYLIPSGGLVEVYPQRVGTVVSTMVEAGDSVSVGDPMVEVTTDRALSGGANVNGALIDSLEGQKALLLAQIERLHQRRDKRNIYLQERISNTRIQMEHVGEQVDIQTEQLDILKKRYRSLAELRKGKLIAEEEYQQRYERFLDEWVSLKQMEQSFLQMEAALDESELDLALLDNEVHAQVDELKSQVALLEQKILQQKGEYGFVITAPAAGTVTSLQVYKGQRLDPSQPLMAILPVDVKMEADLLIPTRAIGFVQPGLSVEIRYDPFPYERFGVYRGKIDSVSKTVLTPNQLNVPLSVQEPVYRARLSLGHDEVQAYGAKYPLQAGMRLEAAILLEKRPLYRWLFNPLYSMKGAT